MSTVSSSAPSASSSGPSPLLVNAVTAGPIVYTSEGTIYTGIPLQTIFSAPAGCSAINYTYASTTGATTLFRQDTSGYNDAVSSKCYPLLFALQVSAHGSVLYSPGVCPSAYTAASANAANGTTTSICCPSGATLGSVVEYPSSSSSGSYASYSACHSKKSTSTTVTINGSTSVVDATAYFRRPTILVAWADTDLGAFTPASLPLLGIISSSVLSNSSTFVSLSSATAAASTPPPPGVSGGAIAGIVIGALAALCLLLALVYYLLRRRRARRVQAASDSSWTPGMATSQVSKPMSELASRDKHELAVAPPELAGGYHEIIKAKSQHQTQDRQELPGS